ncbi:MAG: tetratricopeptide repeat protein [Bacteroidota bacterium]
MSIFNGLYGYEVIMMVLGILLFVVLLFALLRNIVKDKPIGPLSFFFLLPIVMIGFPSFQKISYDNGKLELDKAAHSLSSNPVDSASRQKVESEVEKLKGRAEGDPKGLVALANAHWALGNYDSCQRLTAKALQLAPADTAVRRQVAVLETKIDGHNQFKANIAKLNNYLGRVAAGDKDAGVAEGILTVLDTLKKPTYVSEKDALTIGKAYVALNQPAKALQIADKIIQSGQAGDSVMKFKQSVVKDTGAVSALRLPANVVTRKPVKEFSLEKNVISRRNISTIGH